MLSKLTDLFLGLGLLLALSLHRDGRRWFVTPWPWLGGLVAAATVLPMVLWNADHAWVTFARQFGRVAATSLQPYYLVEFIVAQAMLLNPFVAAFVVRSAASWLRSRPRAGATGTLIATVLPLIAYMTVHAFHDRVQGNWLGPIYPTLALVAAAAGTRNASPRWAGVWARLAAMVLPFGAVCSLLGLLAFAAADGVLPRAVDFARIVRGWPQLAKEIEGIRRDTGAAWIATTDYATNAELSYYLRDEGVPIVQITDRIRYAFEPAPDPGRLGGPVLVVSAAPIAAEGLAGCLAEVSPAGELSRQGFQSFELFLARAPTPAVFTGGC